MSVPANIVEGHGQRSDREFARFLGYAVNSSNELEYHLLTIHDLRLVQAATCRTLMARTREVRRMLHGLLAYLDGKGKKHPPPPPPL